ncbi:hypothetical protein EK21DRAFT_84956 [Setomelanomma holmii]|uniref:2EXR domain-containing protein n=1 Tax=Setomelanomma holmii TaxID=210430 RepID=A0A9P4HKU4_9PLEO|nr:hypothetical protein EK21DRAFT_84956 [Setomelanomma holmii]
MTTGDRSRGKRPQRGYRKFKTGLLNVTPIGDEVAICSKNAQESELLRLPPEIRAMIWRYALGYQNVWLSTVRPIKEASWTDRCQLLRTCRQIYSEAAMMPYKYNTFYVGTIANYSRHLNLGNIQLAQHIRIRSTLPEITRRFPRKQLSILQSVHITLFNPSSRVFGTIHPGHKVMQDAEEFFQGKEFECRIFERECFWLRAYNHG